MKKQILILLVFASISFTVLSQDCSAFYPFEEGISFQITNYDRKGKVSASTDHLISSVTTSGNNTTATINSKMKDINGELITEGEYLINCNGNEVSIDLKSLLSPDLFDQFNGMKTDITGTNVVIPNNLSEGQTLPDASMKMDIDMGGIPMSMTVLMTDRKVLGKESVTTPAGTFVCYVISYTSNIKMGMNRTGTAKQWLAKGVGIVKQEDYNKKGKVTSSTLLTAFNN
jgi:hypothetical protein